MHVFIAERKIRLIKERERGNRVTLPWNIPDSFVPGHVAWIVFYLNAIVRRSQNDYMSPREAFTRVRLDYNRDIRGLTFGDYCQVFSFMEPRNSTMPRTTSAIAMSPTGNEDGAWRFYSLVSRKELVRNQWVKLPTPDVVIERISALHDSDEKVKMLTTPRLVEMRADVGDREGTGIDNSVDNGEVQHPITCVTD